MRNEIEYIDYYYPKNEIVIKLKDVPVKGMKISELIILLKKFDKKYKKCTHLKNIINKKKKENY
jgi:hypothetical protein